ncbi:MAG: hypothetical protein SFY67_19485 [Candidatus Melainabacteria bacterium]|nr:hypothetical protein [Candidatus Melainabacteria bacterium]
MKSKLLLSVLLSAGLSSQTLVLPAFSKDIDLAKASRSEKWLWAHTAIAQGSKISDGDRAKAFKIIEDEEANLDRTPTAQSAISYLLIVDFYNKAGEAKLVKAKEAKAVAKIESASARPGMTESQLLRLAQGLEGLAKNHLQNGIAESKAEMDRAEAFYLTALNLRDRLQPKDPQRGLGYRQIIKFYLDNHEPKKANDFTIRLSQLGSSPVEVLGSGPNKNPVKDPKEKPPCPACGMG